MRGHHSPSGSREGGLCLFKRKVHNPQSAPRTLYCGWHPTLPTALGMIPVSWIPSAGSRSESSNTGPPARPGTRIRSYRRSGKLTPNLPTENWHTMERDSRPAAKHEATQTRHCIECNYTNPTWNPVSSHTTIAFRLGKPNVCEARERPRRYA